VIVMTTTTTYEKAGPVRSGYGDRLLSWLDGEGFGDNRYLKSVFKSDASDDTKYLFALAFYDGLGGKSSGHVDKDEEMTYLVPHEMQDGGFYYLDKMTGKIEVMVEKLPNGLFTFRGKNKYITRLGGRNELSGIRDSMVDGRYFNKN